VIVIRPVMPAEDHASRVSPFRRGVAFLSAALLMVLGLAGVSPELHAWLHEGSENQPTTCAHPGHAAQSPAQHDDEPASATHDCAVAHFAHGMLHPAVELTAQPCEGILRAADFRAFERLALAQPRFLHLPPQAPPAL
jgi:hypothetical protein